MWNARRSAVGLLPWGAMARGFLKRNWVLLIVMIASGLELLYFVRSYNLLGPVARYYNDSDYQYVLSATYVLNGPEVPLFVHPGLSVTFILGLFFALLKKLSLVTAVYFDDFLRSPEPFDRMISLLDAGRAWSALVALAYLVLVYVIALALTGKRWLGALAAWTNVFYVGLLEQSFVVRPEPLSVLLCLLVVPAYLASRRSKDIRLAMVFHALSGMLLSLAFFAKVLALLYLPLWLLMAWDVLRRRPDMDRKDYWGWLGLFLALDGCFLIIWRDIVSLDNALAPFAQRHHETIATFRTWSLATVAAVGLVLVAAALAAGSFRPTSEKARTVWAAIRQAVVMSFAVLAGALASLFLYDLNLSPHPVAWAQKLVATATIETIGFSYVNATPPSRLIDLVANQEIRFMFATMWGFLIVFGAGIYFSERTRRIQLAGLFLMLWLFDCVFALRGSEMFLWSYQIYVLPLITLMLLASGQSILVAKKSRLISSSIAVAVVLAFAVDAVHVQRYRAGLFAAPRTPMEILANVDFSDHGNFTKGALYPRFCAADHLEMKPCLARLAVLFEAAQAKRQEGRFHLLRK